MMKHLAAVATLVLLAGISAEKAVAADLTLAPSWPVSTSTPSWSGFHVGVVGGWARATGSQDDIASALGPVSSGTFSQSGWTAGGTVGYDWQFGAFTVGVEGDFSAASIDGGVVNGVCATFPCSTKINWLHTGRARAGVALGQVMPYVTAGIAAAGLKAANMNNPSRAEPNAVLGAVVGGGMEWAFIPHWSAKAEYLYIPSLGSRAVSDMQTTLNERSVNMVRFGVNYRLWEDGPVTARY
ncbi:MAG: outer membrane beta-barrel protein [Pseudomonadota bacterium]|jgi:outer membrane immunogenic protein